jgi:inner membrane protein
VGCLLLAVLLYGGVLLWLRYRAQQVNPLDRITLAIAALFAILLHLGMDSLNVYGVHPFWPWNNHWFYGDAVFIVEPLFWLATAPLLFTLRARAARVTLGLILLLASVAVLAVHRFAPLWWSMPLLAVLLLLAGRQVSPRAAALTSAATMLFITATFSWGTQVASRHLAAMAGRDFPAFTTLDQVLSPNPANPFCWDVLLVQSGEGRYVIRRGLLSIAKPASTAGCSQLLAGPGTAPLTPVPAPDTAAMQWLGEFSSTPAALAALVSRDCAARELMQFVRAPFATEADGHWILGDLRFDREAGIGMAELAVDPARPKPCRHDVPWIAPRTDLLGTAVNRAGALNQP